MPAENPVPAQATPARAAAPQPQRDALLQRLRRSGSTAADLALRSALLAYLTGPRK